MWSGPIPEMAARNLRKRDDIALPENKKACGLFVCVLVARCRHASASCAGTGSTCGSLCYRLDPYIRCILSAEAFSEFPEHPVQPDHHLAVFTDYNCFSVGNRLLEAE